MHPDTLARLGPFDAHGLITTRTLVKRGYSYEQILDLARDGMLDNVLHGLYADGTSPTPDTQSLGVPLAYLLQRLRPGHMRPMISGEGGLAVRGLGPFELPTLRPLVLVDERNRARTKRLCFDTRHVRQPGPIPEEEHGLALAPVGRCIADLALQPEVTDKSLRLSVDDIRLKRREHLANVADAWRTANHKGSRRLDRLLAAGAFEQESEGERRLFDLVFRAYPPLPDCQVVLLGSLRVDFVFLSAALIIEYHGEDAHAGNVEGDASRVYALEIPGYRTIVVTRRMVWDPAPLAHHIHSIRVDREQRIASGALRRPTLPIQPPRVHDLRTLYPLG